MKGSFSKNALVLALGFAAATIFAVGFAGCESQLDGESIGGEPGLGADGEWGTDGGAGGSVFIPTEPGLYTGAESVEIDGDLTLVKALNAIKPKLSDNANENVFTIILGANEAVSTITLAATLANESKKVNITLKGYEEARKLTMASATGAIFIVGGNITLTLDENIELVGKTSNNTSLVKVAAGGSLIMKDGSKISGNKNAGSSGNGGGGVFVEGGDSFLIMEGGEISGNTVAIASGDGNVSGGGVYLGAWADFTMKGGKISSNTITSSGYFSSYGGGVHVSSGASFALEGGEISGNNVYPYTTYGGGVNVNGGAVFTMTGGVISGNKAEGSSGGNGGGVNVNVNGIFKMTSGVISGNSATSKGSGVLVASSGQFRKAKGAVIYGSNAGDLSNKLGIANMGYAVAQSIPSNGYKYRNTTATADEELSATTGVWN